jgi:hypothetical protein
MNLSIILLYDIDKFISIFYLYIEYQFIYYLFVIDYVINLNDIDSLHMVNRHVDWRLILWQIDR